MLKKFFLLSLIIACSCNNVDEVNSYLAVNNEAYAANIDRVIDQIKICTNNEYYLKEANTYNEKFKKIINSINKNDSKEANHLIQELVKQQQISIEILKKFEYLNESNSTNKNLMINRLLCIENSLIQDLYSMNVQSNFELDGIKLYAIDGKEQNGIYEAKLGIVAVNTEKKYKVVIGNDTIKEYTNHFPVFRVTAPKKGINKIHATVIIDRWGRITSYPFELTYEVK